MAMSGPTDFRTAATSRGEQTIAVHAGVPRIGGAAPARAVGAVLVAGGTQVRVVHRREHRDAEQARPAIRPAGATAARIAFG